MPKTPKRHEAEQYGLPVSVASTVTLSPSHSALWLAYRKHHAELQPSIAQVAKAMMERGLDDWAKEKGIGCPAPAQK